MEFPLAEFEASVDATILRRGREYWRDGLVFHLEELESNEWRASVEGTETYQVRISLQRGVVNDFACSCPYDLVVS